MIPSLQKYVEKPSDTLHTWLWSTLRTCRAHAHKHVTEHSHERLTKLEIYTSATGGLARLRKIGDLTHAQALPPVSRATIQASPHEGAIHGRNAKRWGIWTGVAWPLLVCALWHQRGKMAGWKITERVKKDSFLIFFYRKIVWMKSWTLLVDFFRHFWCLFCWICLSSCKKKTTWVMFIFGDWMCMYIHVIARARMQEIMQQIMPQFCWIGICVYVRIYTSTQTMCTYLDKYKCFCMHEFMHALFTFVQTCSTSKHEWSEYTWWYTNHAIFNIQKRICKKSFCTFKKLPKTDAFFDYTRTF